MPSTPKPRGPNFQPDGFSRRVDPWGARPAGTPQAVAPLPIVATVGASVATPTFATLVGAIEPNGLDTTWWFTWGPTAAMGILTAVGDAGSGTSPVTVTAAISGLSLGTTYYFAAVGQSSAGMVVGNQLLLAAGVAASTSPAGPTVPFGQPLVTIPHFNLPVTLVKNAAIGVVEQDTSEEVVACVRTVITCPLGACPEVPSFGIVEPTFSQAPIDAREILAQVARFEPRAQESAVSSEVANSVDWQLTLTTSSTTG